jgi:hypothetical protein
MLAHLNTLHAADTYQMFVVAIAGIGNPIGYKSSSFNGLIHAIGNYFGSTIGVLNGLGTTATTTYSLVGMNRLGNQSYGPGATGSVEASSPGENLRVVMHKDKQGWYAPVVTHAKAGERPDFGILPVALQPPVPWPLPNPAHAQYAEETAAYHYISRQMGENTDDIRSYYTMSPIHPDAWWTACKALTYPATTPSPYFSPANFAAVRDQLCNEFNYVAHVNGLMVDLDWVLTNMRMSSSQNLADVYNMVRSTVYFPSDDTSMAYDVINVIRSFLTIASSVVGPEAKAIMGVFNGLLQLGTSFSKTPEGADYTAIDTTAANLGNEMDNMWSQAMLGKNIALDIVKSDWGKLQYVGEKLMTQPADGGWKYFDSDKPYWVQIVTNSLEAYYFKVMLPAVWRMEYLFNTTIPNPNNYTYSFVCGNYGVTCPFLPFCSANNYAGAPANAYWIDALSNGRYDWYTFENGPWKSSWACGECMSANFSHAADVTNILFGTGDWLDSSGNKIGVKLNLSKPVFFERWLPGSEYSQVTTPEGGWGAYSSECNN